MIPSRQLVCSIDEAFLIALTNVGLCRAVYSFSCASDTKNQNKVSIVLENLIFNLTAMVK